MLINTRRGHSVNCRGAKGILDEVDVCTKVHNELVKNLKELKSYGVDCTSSEKISGNDLAYGVNKNNKNKADYFASIHANVTKGGFGSEVLLYPTATKEAKDKANEILKGLEKLGFRNRGIKYRDNLYELKRTNNKAMIIELFFLDSEKDVSTYKKVGDKAIADVIAKALTGKEVKKNESKPQVKEETWFRVVAGSYNDRKEAEKQQEKLKNKGFDSFLVAFKK